MSNTPNTSPITSFFGSTLNQEQLKSLDIRNQIVLPLHLEPPSFFQKVTDQLFEAIEKGINAIYETLFVSSSGKASSTLEKEKTLSTPISAKFSSSQFKSANLEHISRAELSNIITTLEGKISPIKATASENVPAEEKTFVDIVQSKTNSTSPGTTLNNIKY